MILIVFDVEGCKQHKDTIGNKISIDSEMYKKRKPLSLKMPVKGD